ncbi:putative membrane protein [Corynebacterium resistens DSM 45100]|uniref:Probable membrane transporter protein n=1 Tax=Corynebacterium resistens (strain DSM 45100 / JCM 12819 / GTC 2026 / SICGH 158) TaxID=662755 RepID=F8DZN5_CORRG|nr:sulfite exporter TauE/SafE family protein [Corynebacterium resistens]AEI09083.1 putative membrane protein [Corynebacterium resistens DSM 45100]
MSVWILVGIVFLAAFAGACLQRISGMGMGLLAAPVFALVLGPIVGVMVVNVLAAINALINSVSARSFIDWRRFWLIGPVMILGAIPAVYLVEHMSVAWLQILVGSMLVIALTVVTFGQSQVPVANGATPAVTSGIVGGFMNTIAGVAGPAITVYAQAARWEQRSFAATLQPLFVVSGVVSFAAKFCADAADMASVPTLIWPAGLVAMVLGIFSGKHLSAKVSRNTARNVAITVATLGALSAVVRGVLSL